MTVRPAVLLARLAQLGHVLAQLDRLKALPAEARAVDPLHELAAERALHVAAEAVFDVGHHLLAGRGLAIPATYREVIPALVAAGILDAELGRRLDGIAGMRNILVHDYVSIDPARVWGAIDAHLDDLRATMTALASVPELRGA